jgi:hypothetical protein
MDTRMATGLPREPACQSCGTWTCAACGWKRHRANLSYDGHTCLRCGGTEGSMEPTRHRAGGWLYWADNPRIGPRCYGWSFGASGQGWGLCSHESCRGINYH